MKLNPAQIEAVRYQKGPLLVIAGAGTGKTTVITERVKWLITKKGVSPSQILALTFTEKAAREMEERVDQILPLGYSQFWISTFHSFCDRILRDEISHIGLNPSFKLMTQAETVLFLRQHLFDFKLKYFRPTSNPNKFLTAMISHFSRLQDEDIQPKQYQQFARKLPKNPKTEEDRLEILKTKELAIAFSTYQKIKEKESLFDFADLIGYTLRLFRERPNLLRDYQKRFAFVLVDEFQDTNIAQYELVKMLAPPRKNPNLTVTGDDSQSIYKFRGAAISNILSFREDYKNSKMVVLTENYRSTQTLLDQSHQLIKQNDPDTLESRLGIPKNLKSNSKAREIKSQLLFADRVENEADLVVKEIQDLTKKEYSFKDIAILVRANNHSEPFTRSLSRHGIPYQFLGPSYLFRKPEIKDLVAYLQLLVDPQDDLAFFRVASLPVFKISPQRLALLRSFAKRNNLSLFEASGKKEKKKKFSSLLKMIKRHLKLLPKETGGQILYYFLEDTGLLKTMLNPNSEPDQQKALNVSKFFDKIKSFEADNEQASVFFLLDWVTLRLEMGESPRAAEDDWTENDAVNILTVHSSKGLEFPIVFVVNLVNQRFPTNNRRELIPIPQPLIKEFLPEGDPHEQEERRLFYVAITRAKDRVYLTGSKFYGQAKREKRLSPFVAEMLGEKDLAKQLQKKQILEKSSQISLLSWKKPAETKNEKVKTKRLSVNRLSYSQINSFEVCPLQYKYQYLIKLPTLPSAAQTTGIVLHRTLKEFYQKQIVEKGKLPLAVLLQIMEENWSSLGFKSKAHEKKVKQEAKKMITNYYQQEIIKKPISPVAALEHSFSFKISSKLKVGGIIDRVDLLDNGEIEVVDYKTGNKIKDQKEVDKDEQLTLYALAVSTIPELPFHKPVDRVILSLYFLSQGVKVSSRRTQEQLEEFREKILDKAKEIEASSFDPKPGTPFPCNFCQYKLLCEAW